MEWVIAKDDYLGTKKIWPYSVAAL
jgi:hypothetical protein